MSGGGNGGDNTPEFKLTWTLSMKLGVTMPGHGHGLGGVCMIRLNAGHDLGCTGCVRDESMGMETTIHLNRSSPGCEYGGDET